jgi:ATP-binding cassette subfamily B (MDR/TAP) protein 1
MLSGCFFVIGLAVRKYETRADMSKDSSSTFLEQCLSGIRVVQTFSMSQPLMKRWITLLADTERTGFQQARIRGLEGGVTMLSGLCVLGVGLYYGSKLVQDGLNYGYVITVSLAYSEDPVRSELRNDRFTFKTTYNITNIHYMCFFRLSALNSVRKSVVSLRNIRHHIERQPYVDIRDSTGITVAAAAAQLGWSANISLEQVTFAYPSRPDVKVLDGVSFSAEAGKLTAICGGSGAGKSCVASLLIRQYDPASANVANAHDSKEDAQREDLRIRLAVAKTTESAEKGFLDTHGDAQTDDSRSMAIQGDGIIRLGGLDVRTYNLRSLRSCISVVQQEPQLLCGTVLVNIAAGLTGTPLAFRSDLDADDDKKIEVTRERCVEALKIAEAWDFVQSLPQGIDTKLSGGRNDILSGGQRQRLAIARALVRRPSLLILDEATSALSSDVELRIRNNLEAEQQSTGMTIVSIAHRLQFAQHAHKIVVMERGRVVDEGTFDELIHPGRTSRVFADMAATGKTQRAGPSGGKRSLEFDMTEIPAKSDSSITENIVSSENSEGEGKSSRDSSTAEESSPRSTRQAHLRILLRGLGSKRLFLIAALLLGLFNGCSFIATSYTLGRTVAVLSGAPDGKTIGNFYLWIWIGFAVLLSLTVYGQNIFTTGAQKRFEKVIASTAVTALMRQEVSFFEEETGSAGSLTAGIAKHSGNYAQALSESAVTVSRTQAYRLHSPC